MAVAEGQSLPHPDSTLSLSTGLAQMLSAHRPKLILASTSAARRMLLSAAAVDFECEAPVVDEARMKAELADLPVADIASRLAQCKAQEVSRRHADAIVIGADQTLELDGTGFDKPADPQAAGAQLLQLRGRSHHLHSAICCSRNADVLWQHRSTATLTMRPFSDAELAWYIRQSGEKLVQSVGGYQIEGPALQLFSHIEGDYFTILGLPMLPLLEFLREQGALLR